jgi:HlyD family secretion protein
MKRILRIFLVVILLGGVGTTIWWYLTTHPEALAQVMVRLNMAPATPGGPLTASGTIEAEEVVISAEVEGRILEINADEGDEVGKGDVLVLLDRDLLLAQKRQAEAAVERAAAELAKVQSGARSEEIRQAQANLAVAEAGLQQARQSLADAVRLRDNPQQLDAEIDAARADVEVAKGSLAAAQSGTQAAQADYDMWERQWTTVRFLMDHPTVFHADVPGPGGQMVKRTVIVGPGPADLDPLSVQWDQAGGRLMLAWDAVAIAQTNLDGTERRLAMLEEMKAKPLAAQAQVNAAAGQVKVAEARVAETRANLALVKAGALEEQTAMARAQLRRAEAAVKVLDAQLAKMVLTAPRAGLVLKRAVNPGETAVPGATLLTLADLDRVKLTVYIPEDQIGKVKIGQKVLVQVDSYPGRDYQGTVTYISPEAEFTPKNVQTKNDRVNTVFAVKVSLDNAHHDLKPGMSADARLANQ